MGKDDEIAEQESSTQSAVQSQESLLQTRDLHSVSIKIPAFWSADPHMWFGQVEAQFAVKGITAEKTRYYHVVANLSSDAATEVRDLIMSPPQQNPYTALKTALLDRTSESHQRRLQQLLTAEELGDRKPSQLLRRMEQLLEKPLDQPIFEEIFLSRLPSRVRLVLAATTDRLSIADKAAVADKLMEVTALGQHEVNSVSPATPSTDFSTLANEVQKIRKDLDSVLNTISRRRSQSRSRSLSKNCNDRSGFCFYHYNFGENARKCQSPCAYKSTNAHGSSASNTIQPQGN